MNSPPQKGGLKTGISKSAPLHSRLRRRLRRLRRRFPTFLEGDQHRKIAAFLGKAPVRRWVGRTHGPYACRTHVLRAPGADPGHPGGRVVAASDQYVSTTANIISRGPQLVRKAVLMQT